MGESFPLIHLLIKFFTVVFSPLFRLLVPNPIWSQKSLQWAIVRPPIYLFFKIFPVLVWATSISGVEVQFIPQSF